MTEEIKNLFNNTKTRFHKYKKYFSTYEELLKNYKDKDITFVEIGVQNGGSLGVWKKYFSNSSRVIGIDLNSDCKKFEKDGIEIFIGNQSDPNFWEKFFKQVGKVDIILDDGGHTNLDQIITTVSVVDKINDGGILIVEDTHTSYISEYNSGKKFSFVEFTKKIIDDINSKNRKNFKQFKFSLSDYIYSVQTFESIIAFKIDRKKCDYDEIFPSKGKEKEITDMTWAGNEINVNFLKKPFHYFRFVIRLNQLTKFFKHKINNKMISKYFK